MQIAALALAGARIGRGLEQPAPRGVEAQAIAPTATQTSNTAAPPSAVPTPSDPGAAPAQPTAATPAPPNRTPAPSDPQWPELIAEPFDLVSTSWPAVRGPSWETNYRDGWFELRLTNRPSISYSNPLRGRDFWLGADVRIERGQAGLFFLRNRPNDFYRLLIDADGRFRLEWQQVGFSRPLLEWTASDAIRRGAGAVNRLAVRRTGNELALFANGTMLATYALPPGNSLEGRVGLALDAPYGQRDGAALFDNLVVRAPPE